jgi:transposase
LSALVGLEVSTSTLSSAERHLSEALAPVYEQARKAVSSAPALHMDETGSRREGKRSWMWLAASATMAVFLVSAGRGIKAFEALVGRAFGGLLTSDRWHVYNRHEVSLRQLCWAHLLRDFQKIADRACSSARIGGALIESTLQMFEIWGRFKDQLIDRTQMKADLEPIRRQIESLLDEGTRLDRFPASAATCQNLLALKQALWTFVEHDHIEPTNNHAERLIRNAVLCRNRSHGTWSERGDRYLERTLTALVTLRLQNREPLPWLVHALQSHFGLGPPPSLVNP